jgi:hypothetical protein
VPDGFGIWANNRQKSKSASGSKALCAQLWGMTGRRAHKPKEGSDGKDGF